MSIQSKCAPHRYSTFAPRTTPDVLCLQELKCEMDNFPVADFEAAGYHSAVFGQRQYNGVAVLSRREPSAVHEVSMVAGDSAARWVQIEIDGLHIVSLYAPNGNEVGSDKYAYKLNWYAQARRYLQEKFKPAQDSVVLTGDFQRWPPPTSMCMTRSCGRVKFSARNPNATHGKVSVHLVTTIFCATSIRKKCSTAGGITASSAFPKIKVSGLISCWYLQSCCRVVATHGSNATNVRNAAR